MISLLGASIITCAVLYGLLAIIMVAVCLVAELPLYIAFAVCIVVILVQFLISPFLTDLTQKWFYKTRFDAEVPAYLREFIQKVCNEQNMKYPRIGFIDDGAPNAFTYGHTKNDARIVLTRGIFELLSEEEVKAVVAHELGHAVHYDMLIMTMVQLVPMVLYAVYDICMESARSSGDSKDKGYVAAVGIVALVLYIVVQYVILWLSRVREYYADEFSAQVTRNPNALASALVNIGFGLSTREKAQDAKGSASTPSTLGIFNAKHSKSLVVNCYRDGKIREDGIKNAMKWELWNVWAKFYELGSTHPLTSKRIQRLGGLAEQMNQRPLVRFDLEKPESFVDDFLREVLVCIMPWVGFLACLVVGGVMLATGNDSSETLGFIIIAAGVVVGLVLSCLKYLFTHPRSSYHEANVAGLLSEVKVSMIKSIPAQLSGTIIGRGNPGCIFNEDFVIQDKTGILFLDYNQPLWIINKIFALFKSPEYFDKQVTVKGWYRRNMVPFFELYSMTVDGQEKKCYSYGFGWAWRLICLALAVLALVAVAFFGFSL